jgi:CheY-like chemotaxis protein
MSRPLLGSNPVVSGANILVVSQHRGECELIQDVLGGLGATTEITEDRTHAAGLLERRKFSGIFLGAESSLTKSFELVGQIRRSPSNQKTPVVLIVDPGNSKKLVEAYKAGVTFTVLRPLNEKKLAQILSLARGSMLAEQRNYHRVPASLPIRFRAGPRTGEGKSIDISRTGVLFGTAEAMRVGQTVETEISLPGEGSRISAGGEAARVDQEGRVAIRFTRLPVDDLERLKRFLESQATVEAPSVSPD